MSSVTETKTDYIPLGRRIGEVLEEKGGAFTIRAFAPRVGLSKDTLGRIIDGTRHIKPSELKTIAERLSISIERLKREDTLASIPEIDEQLENKYELQRALLVARRNHEIALGITEKCDASMQLARVYYALRKYDQAHDLLLESYQYAQKIFEKYSENDRLYNVLSKLMMTFTVRKEFSNLSAILQRVETVFETNPEKQAAIHFSKAMLAEQMGETEKARSELNKSLDLYQNTGKQKYIGRADLNVGYFEFKQKNYLAAKNSLVRAIERLGDDDYYKLIAIKEYVKTLLKLEEQKEAIFWLENTLDRLETYPDLKGKFLVLLSFAKNDPSFAESTFLIPNIEKKVLLLTCKYLIRHYTMVGDSNLVMKYSVLADRCSLSDSDLIHEEDL